MQGSIMKHESARDKPGSQGQPGIVWDLGEVVVWLTFKIQ
jgi:hypothetical protein